MGLIAQEVKAVFPEIVSTDDQGYQSVDYSKLTAFLIEVNKAQELQIASLKQTNEGRQNKLEDWYNSLVDWK